MLPQTFEIRSSDNTIVPADTAAADVNALSSPVAASDSASQIKLTWTSAATITIEGIDADGNFQTETVDTPAGSNSLFYYKSVSSLVPSAAIALFLVVYNDNATTPTIPVNWRQTPFNLIFGASLITGDTAETVTFQYSLDAPNKDFAGSFASLTTWFNVDDDKDLSPPITAARNAPAQAVRVVTKSDSVHTMLIRIVQGDNPQ